MAGPVGVSLERLGGVLVANNQVQGPSCRARWDTAASDQTLHRCKCRHTRHYTIH